MKRGLVFLGVGFLALAFVAAASEVAAHNLVRDLGALVPLKHVWATLDPDGLEAARAWGRESPMGPLLWRSAEAAMWLPGWVLFGAPGFALIILFRDKSEGPDQAHEEGLFLYDELARAARNDPDLTSTGDDFRPTPPDHIEPADSSFADEHIDEALLELDDAAENSDENTAAEDQSNKP